jgi:acyl-coenzyme A thioesterase PaaI-like protein
MRSARPARAGKSLPRYGSTFTQWLIASGKVIKPGRILSVCSGEVIAFANREAKLVAMMQTTMMQVSA